MLPSRSILVDKVTRQSSVLDRSLAQRIVAERISRPYHHNTSWKPDFRHQLRWNSFVLDFFFRAYSIAPNTGFIEFLF